MTPIARGAVAAAVAAWVGVTRSPLLVVVAASAAWIVRRRLPAVMWTTVVVSLVIGSGAGLIADMPPPALAAGPVELQGAVRLELSSDWGWRALVATTDGTVLVQAEERPGGGWVEVHGHSDGAVGKVAERWIRSTIQAREVRAGDPPGLHRRIAEMLRQRIVDGVRPEDSQSRALLLGFLVGDTEYLSEVAGAEMRRTGLSHLVAVSGSNVALFLAGLAMVVAPLAIHPAGRTLLVLNGVLIFGALTRWEPSVVRASAMAAVVAVGRFVGVPLEPTTALAAVAGGAVILDPSLAGSVGFQLSVAASAGLLFGARIFGTSGPIGSLVTATVSAQVAVAPLLLAAFGTIPLLSPIANLVAIPIVAGATVVGGVGAVFGFDPLVYVASGLAEVVLVVARVAAPWPQLDWVGFTLVGTVAILIWRFRLLRPPAALAAAVSLVVLVWPRGGLPERGLVMLDVGQGDSILVELSGFTMLVDGGPDPALLASRLEWYGVDSIDLMVATHVHADHVSGLVAVLERMPVGMIWAAFEPHLTPASRRLVDAADTAGVRMVRPAVGDHVTVGEDRIEVAGPLRRYASPNDQSIVLVVEIDGFGVLLAGDIETVAQADLSIDAVDVLKVPHQGAATSTPGWLRRHAGTLSLISVGANDFGHPADWVVRTLSAAGARVLRTDRGGDVVVEIDRGEMKVRSAG